MKIRIVLIAALLLSISAPTLAFADDAKYCMTGAAKFKKAVNKIKAVGKKVDAFMGMLSDTCGKLVKEDWIKACEDVVKTYESAKETAKEAAKKLAAEAAAKIKQLEEAAAQYEASQVALEKARAQVVKELGKSTKTLSNKNTKDNIKVGSTGWITKRAPGTKKVTVKLTRKDGRSKKTHVNLCMIDRNGKYKLLKKTTWNPKLKAQHKVTVKNRGLENNLLVVLVDEASVFGLKYQIKFTPHGANVMKRLSNMTNRAKKARRMLGQRARIGRMNP